MSIIIAETDSFIELAKALKMDRVKLQNKIIDSFISDEIMGGEVDDYGLSVEDMCAEIGYTIPETYVKIFGGNAEDYMEEFEWFGSLVFIGDGDCPECGGELSQENDGCDGQTWVNESCNNCTYKNTGEPDWDCLPGGKDFY